MFTLLSKSSPKTITLFRYKISTELIKKQHQELLKKTQINPDIYPKTFEEKAMILNSPKTIQLLQVVEFGTKYKKSNKWFPLLLVGFALGAYILEKTIPIRVTDRYFMISPQSPSYPSGYFFGAINFQQPFYLYLPVFFSIGHISKFIKVPHISLMILWNILFGGILGQKIVDERIQSYEVWNNEHLSHGEGCLMSILIAFCTALGPINSFTHLKSKIGLQTIPGLGVVRRGLPVGFLTVLYLIANAGAYYFEETRNHQVVGVDLAMGIIFGLILRRFCPIH